jgi:glycosyltransferase involved in cell wall biosynthesis
MNAAAPQFSVCIPAYNDFEAFSRCLSAVLRQKGVTLECIVTDDSATDHIAAYAARQNDSRIVYSRNIPALGAPENWNRAIALAGGEYITLLHQDDWYRSDNALKTVHEIVSAEGADALFCGRALYENGKCLGEYLMTLKKAMNFHRDFPGRTLMVNTLGHPGVAFFHRRHNNICYDADLIYFSDTDYFARLITAASKVAVCPEPLVAIGRSKEQLSYRCLTRIDTLVPQLAHGLRKHRAGSMESGLALARFFAGNLRHWRVDSLSAALRKAREAFPFVTFGVFILSFPVFFVHMLYRAAYRQAAGKAWG